MPALPCWRGGRRNSGLQPESSPGAAERKPPGACQDVLRRRRTPRWELVCHSRRREQKELFQQTRSSTPRRRRRDGRKLEGRSSRQKRRPCTQTSGHSLPTPRLKGKPTRDQSLPENGRFKRGASAGLPPPTELRRPPAALQRPLRHTRKKPWQSFLLSAKLL